jgi:hypothetical protein
MTRALFRQGDSKMRTTATLIATLMLGMASCAYAQGGPGEGLGGGAGGPGGALGIGGGGPGGRDPGGAGPTGGGPGGDAPAAAQGSGGGGESLRGGGDGPGRAERAERGGPSGDASDGPAPSRAAETPQRERGAGRKSAEDSSESRGSKSDGDSKASRAERRASERAKDSKDAAEKSVTRDKSEKTDDKKGDTAAGEKSDKPDGAVGDTAGKGVKDGEGATAKKEADPARAEKAERVKQVDLSGDKRDRVQHAFRDKSDVKRRTDVDIDISVGRRMPRDWHFFPVPIAVIELVPEYRDYVFIYVEDEYVICDPDTYEVVAVIPAGGSGGYASSGSGDSHYSTRIELDDDQRELILKSVRLGREVDVSNLEVGWSVPADIELERFPKAVLSEADELSACRYFIADDQLAIVDPDEDKVVLLIDKS